MESWNWDFLAVSIGLLDSVVVQESGTNSHNIACRGVTLDLIQNTRLLSTKILTSKEFMKKVISEADRSGDERVLWYSNELKPLFEGPSSLGNVLQQRVARSAELKKVKVYNPYKALVPDFENIPLMISMCWWARFSDVDLSGLLLRRPPPEDVFTRDQLTRATEFIFNLLAFKKIVDERRLYIGDEDGDEERVLSQYSRIFCSDERANDSIDDKSQDILIVAKDKLFLLQVMRPDGSLVGFKSINNGLYRVCDMALHTEPTPSVPLLTTSSPRIWRDAVKILEETSERNSVNLKLIGRAPFAICLDSYSSHKRDDITIHQFSSNFDCGNRWFDKPLEIVVNNSSRSGLCANLKYVNTRLVSKIANYLIANEPGNHQISESDKIKVEMPRLLEWDVSDAVIKLIGDAKNGVRDHVYPMEACVHNTSYYGKTFIDQIAKVDPDAMVMIAICLAWYRIMNFTPYTALIYSTNNDGDPSSSLIRIPQLTTEKFIQSFDDDNVLYKDKLEAFKKAADAIKNIKTERESSPDIVEHADSLVNEAKDKLEKDVVYNVIGNTILESTRDINITVANFDRNYLFTSGIMARHNKSCAISYFITDNTISFTLSSHKPHFKELCFEMRRELDRAIKELLIIFPLRSQIWGTHWKTENKMVNRETVILQNHRYLTDKYVSRRHYVEERFRDFRRPMDDYEST